MSPSLNAEQHEIRAVAEQFLRRTFSSTSLRAAAALPKGYDDQDWQRISELGWPALAVPEQNGGLGFGQLERCLLLQAMGAVLAPLPFLSSAVLATDALALIGGSEAGELLGDAAEGTRRIALVAHGDLHSASEPAGGVRARPDGDRWMLEGDGGATLDAAGADRLLVVADGPDGLSLSIVDPDREEVEVEPVEQMDQTRRFARVRFSGAPAERVDGGQVDPEMLSEVIDRGALALAAEMAGAARQCVEMAVQYAKERRQFGVAIASFQAIKHKCADMAIEVDAAEEAVLHGAEIADRGDRAGGAALARAAKAAAGDAFALAAATSVQIHGGIGFTEEHDAQLFFKRAHVSQRMFGSSAANREELARRLGW